MSYMGQTNCKNMQPRQYNMIAQ